MKILNVFNLTGTVSGITDDSYIINTRDAIVTIPKEQLDDNQRVPIPEGLLDPVTRRIKKGFVISLAKLTYANGYIRYALDEKIYNSKAQVPDVQQNETQNAIVKEMLDDLNKQESLSLEFKSSIYHPANPEDANDHMYQMKEVIRQCVGGANSQIHSLRLYVGIRNLNGKYVVTGIQDELTLFGKDFDLDKLQVTFLNMTKQLTTQSFLMCITFNIIQYQGKTVLRLDIDNHSKRIVFYGNRGLYVRVGSSLHCIDDDIAFIDFIKQSIS